MDEKATDNYFIFYFYKWIDSDLKDYPILYLLPGEKMGVNDGIYYFVITVRGVLTKHVEIKRNVLTIEM